LTRWNRPGQLDSEIGNRPGQSDSETRNRPRQSDSKNENRSGLRTSGQTGQGGAGGQGAGQGGPGGRGQGTAGKGRGTHGGLHSGLRPRAPTSIEESFFMFFLLCLSITLRRFEIKVHFKFFICKGVRLYCKKVKRQGRRKWRKGVKNVAKS